MNTLKKGGEKNLQNPELFKNKKLPRGVSIKFSAYDGIKNDLTLRDKEEPVVALGCSSSAMVSFADKNSSKKRPSRENQV
jgi:hypothetical protein